MCEPGTPHLPLPLFSRFVDSISQQYHKYLAPPLFAFRHWSGDLPRAAPRRPLPPPPLPNPLTLPGIDDPVAWAALLYAGIKLCMVVLWLFKRRNRGPEGTEEAGRGLLGLAGRVKRMGAWVASRLLWRRRRGGGGRTGAVSQSAR